ncbi:hypothetical protein XA68_12960 [Ophiocordyceps unilateralis]|uniref:Uncharacterized protein n=1 Tax=Ophiocordyceps unilateralis TaxID=268505 RepID=A0A2A9PCQ0_OPHUN|nr:hypothetical protein XA68_12960 [Ophiocordyceps unilateralis]
MPRPKRTRHEPAASSNEVHKPSSRPRGRPRKSTALSVNEEAVIRSALRKRDAVLDSLVNEDVTTAASGPATGDDDTLSSVGVAATPAMRRRGLDTSGLDLADDDVFGTLDDSFADGEETSSDMRRPRSRQSSSVGRHDPPIRPSSRGPNTPGISSSLNLGFFRRRPREPSILGTSRKPLSEGRSEEATNQASSDVEPEPEVEAASTPFDSQRATRATPSSRPVARSSSRKRKNDEALDSVNGQSQESSSLTDVATDAIIDSDSELSVLASPPPPPPLGFLPRPVTPGNADEVIAPPVSSGSESGADAWPDIHVLAKRRRRPSAVTPLQTGHLSDVSSPPSLTHSPNYGRGRWTRRGRTDTTTKKQGPESPPKLTTADLTNLLPKRRHKRARHLSHLEGDDELDGTDLASDEDELSYLDQQRSRKARHGRSSRLPPLQPAASVHKSKQTAPPSTRQPSVKKTYRQPSSDKENESNEDEEDDEEEAESSLLPLPDDTFDSTVAADDASADELKQAARKFKEVDKWELEFEEVTESSSPQDAR